MHTFMGWSIDFGGLAQSDGRYRARIAGSASWARRGTETRAREGRNGHVAGHQSPAVFDGRPHGRDGGDSAPGRVLGANDQVRLGFIGVGNRGCQLLRGFLPHADAKIVALCDVYEPYLRGRYERLDPRFTGLGKRIAQMPELPEDVARVKDFREILDRKDVDAVVIATPDHWHAIQAISACKAGKDVYIEKPLSMTIVEGRAMVDSARRNDRVVQVGTHRRSSRMYARPRRAGALGGDRQGDGGACCVYKQHGDRGDRPCARVRATGWPRLGLVAGAAAGATVPGDDHAVQVSLVEFVFIADRELGSSLL